MRTQIEKLETETHTHYLRAKQSLIAVAKQIKSSTNDKPLIRQVINDTADSLIKDLPYSLSDATRQLYSNWLHSLAGKLHP